MKHYKNNSIFVITKTKNMEKIHMTIFNLNGNYHSTQDKKISYDWCIEGATYEIDNHMYKAKVTELMNGNVKIKICNLEPLEYITL